jgi:hypothetical protein
MLSLLIIQVEDSNVFEFTGGSILSSVIRETLKNFSVSLYSWRKLWF